MMDILIGILSMLWEHFKRAIAMYAYVSLPVWLMTICFHLMSGQSTPFTFITMSMMLNSNLLYWHLWLFLGCFIVSSWTHKFDMW